MGLYSGCAGDQPQQTALPCPACGGKDRFRFDDRQGAGTWFCNQCEPQSGDGLDLVKNVRQCSLTEAAQLVADILGVSPKSKAPDLASLMAKTTPGESRYLINKGLSSHKLPILPDGSLLLILQNMAGDCTGAQIIRPDGTKKLIAGSRKKARLSRSNRCRNRLKPWCWQRVTPPRKVWSYCYRPP